MNSVKRVLVVTYTFPPTGGAGVQRVTKFVKYLSGFGWMPTVLTAANPSVPLTDASLDADVPDDVLVQRAKTWEPSYRIKSAVSVRKQAPGLLSSARKMVAAG